MINNRTPTAPTQGADLGDRRDARSRAIYHYRQARRYAGLAVEEAWKTGAALTEVRESTEHGMWRSWLETSGIPKSTAHRWMQLAAGIQMSHVGHFSSIAEALKALPPKAKPAAPNRRTPKMTATEKALADRSAVLQRAQDAEDRALAAEQSEREAHQRTDYAEAALLVQDGYAPGRDVLTERQEAIRQLKARVSDLEQTNGTLLGENRGLRRLLKQRDKLIETLQGAVA